MNFEIRKKYETAKKISEKTQELAKKELREGLSVLKLAEMIEREIIENDGKLAFPVNISINEIAAHFTPDSNDTSKFKAGDLVKIDVGAHIDGYIWDAAFTKEIGSDTNELAAVSERALEAALKVVKSGVRVFEISEAVASTVENSGFKVIENLCGHGLDRFVQHAKPSIPNSRNNNKEELKDGAFAIEVFTTDGAGYVKESSQTFIYRYLQERPVRLPEARKILSKAKVEFEGVPFAARWIKDIATGIKLQLAIQELVQSGCLEEYPVLKEAGNGMIAQTETTILL